MKRPFLTPITRVVGIVLLLMMAGCARMPDLAQTRIAPKSFGELRSYISEHSADVDIYRLRGPFAVTERTNIEIRTSTDDVVMADLFLSAHKEKAPLVIFLHGYDSRKENHAYQAMHLASWGMHGLTLQLPARGSWLANGRTLARLVRFIGRSPNTIDSRIDAGKIILVGHSFGGAAVSIALGEGVTEAGGILLDPAVVGIDLSASLRKIGVPVMVIGADEHVSMANNRNVFYRYVRSGIAELSIEGASHDDAQYPADTAAVSEEHQVTFLSALTAAAFSIAIGGNIDYAWNSYAGALTRGIFFNAKRK